MRQPPYLGKVVEPAHQITEHAWDLAITKCALITAEVFPLLFFAPEQEGSTPLLPHFTGTETHPIAIGDVHF